MLHTLISPPDGRTAAFTPFDRIPDHDRHRRRFLKLVAQFERDEIEAAVDGLIEMLDAADGDPDLEVSGTFAPTAPIADPFEDPEPTTDGLPGDPVDAEDGGDMELSGDELGDQAWLEWDGRVRREHQATYGQEDDEEEDADEDDEADEYDYRDAPRSRHEVNAGKIAMAIRGRLNA